MRSKFLLIAGLLMAVATIASAQVTMTQTSTSDFQKGTGQNVIIANDQISLQSKMTSINNFEASTNLPQYLKGHQLLTWQNYVFCVGGSNNTSPVNGVYRATQQADGISSWTTMNAMPVALTHIAAVATQRNLIVMGGKNDDGVSNKIYIAPIDAINASLGEWEESTLTLPQPLWGAQAIVVHDNIYLIGGANTDDETAASNKVYCLKLNARGNIASITTVTALPAARSGHAVATYDSKIYVMGGHDATGALKNTVYRATVNLNGNLSSWASQAALPEALSNLTAVSANGFLGVIGGMGADLPSNQFYYTYLDGSQLSWTTSNAVLSARTHSAAACAFGNKVIFSGGENINGSAMNYTRCATIVTGENKVQKSCFVSLPFDLGNPMKNVQQLTYTLNQGSNTSYEILYRVADESLVYGNWTSCGTNNPANVNQTKASIQYMFRITATGSNDLAIEEVNAIYGGYTQLAGNLNDISVLTLQNSPYMVTGDITFTTGIHSVEAGVEIYFQENTGLKITYACVNFNGTENQPILLTYVNADGNRWKGIYFCGEASWNHNGGVYEGHYSSMSHTTISNAGYGDNQALLRCYATPGSISFTNCTFTGSTYHGVRMDESNCTFTNCTITNNERNALDLSSSTPTLTSTTLTNSNYAVYFRNHTLPTFTNCEAYNNNYGIRSCTPDRDFTYGPGTLNLHDNTIEIRTVGGRIYDNHTWNRYDSYYWVEGDLEINDGDSPNLYIEAGNTICMNPGCVISVYGGGIQAIGTATDSIVFTPYNGAIGGWGGFRFYNESDSNSSSALRYCVIEKALTNIFCEYTTQPSLMYSTVRQGVNYNIDITRYSAIDLDGDVISDGNFGITLWDNSSANLVAVTFDNISNSCVRIDGASNSADFHYCTMNNSNIGVRYSDPNMNIPSYLTNNRITFNNVTSPVGLNGGRITNRSWATNEYGIYGSIEVRADGNPSDTAHLNIDAGSVLRFAQNNSFLVSWSNDYKGRIFAEGTEDDPIIFTSLNGETGGWNGLKFYGGTQSSSLKHCVFEKVNASNVYIEDTRKVRFEDCEFNNGSSYGMLFNSANFVNEENLSNLSFSGNQHDGIAINGGTVSDDRTWPVYDYYILENVRICSYNEADTTRLTLKPGTTLHFAQDKCMYVYDYYNGEFFAEGTAEAPITFTSINGAQGRWHGLHFYSPTKNASLKHCVFEYSLDDDVYVENTHNVHFEDCEFKNATDYGIRFNSPQYVHGENMNNLSFSGNRRDGIAINGGTLYGQNTWDAYDYYILSDLYVRGETSSDTARLTLSPGTNMRFADNQWLQISYSDCWGSLIAEGTEEAPITFTSINGQVAGWRDVRFYNRTVSSSLKHCIFEKGYEQNVYVESTGNILFENCEFRYSSNRGIYFNYSASPTVRLCYFHHNAITGILLNNNSTPYLGGSPEYANDILFNGPYAIYQEGENNINMSYNYLGTTDSLYIESQLVRDKLDDGWKGRVNVFPVSTLPVAPHTLTGSLLYDGNPNYTMTGSTVMVKNFDDEVLYQTTTDATGRFAFNNMEPTGARKVDFIPNVDVEATITTVDALAVMLHFVHETMLTGHRLAAADVNGSGTVNGTDALFIQKRYVHQIETFPAGDMYYGLFDSINYNLYATDLAFTALCYGDVNASYVTNRDGINLLSEGQTLIGPDQYYEIPVRVQNAIEAGAISLKLNYPAEYLSIEQVILPNGEKAMIYDNEGQVTISWYSLDPMFLSDGDLMLTLGIRTKDFLNLSEPIVFGLDSRSELANGSAEVLSDVTLTLPELITLGMEGLDENGDFALSVYPNPMHDCSVVRYNLPAEGRVSFTVYDLLGRAVQSVETGIQSIGEHEIALTGLASGVYMGRLAVSGNSEEVQIVKIVVK